MPVSENYIADLKHKIANLRVELGAAEQDMRNAILEKNNLRIGDIIRTKKGVVLQVSKIDIWGEDSLWVVGHPKKADGTFSKSIRLAGGNKYGDWTKVEEPV